MKMDLKRFKKKQGLTLIEALIWFAIFAAVVVGVFSLYASARTANFAAKTNKEITYMFASIQEKYANDSTADLYNKVAYQFGIFPSTLKVAVASNGYIGDVTHSFGGRVVIYGYAPNGFDVSYYDIPSGEACLRIVREQKKTGWTMLNNTPYERFTIQKMDEICNNPAEKGNVFALSFRYLD